MEETENTSLARYTTLKVGGEAHRLCHPTNQNEIIDLLDRLKNAGEPWFILGGGSNLLVSSSGFAGTVVRMTQMTRISNPEPGVIEADAGVRLPHLARYAASIGLAGLEFAVGIPGTVGGAAVMNAGAHGSCMAEITESVTIFDTTTWQVKTLSAADIRFVYRNSNINPDTQIVISSRYRLQPDVAENIQARTEHNEAYRWKTQPVGWPNAGSTFKNPLPDKTAGFLLDKSGAKQLKEGQAAVSDIHANFVINLGGATSTEVTSLLARMQDTVFAQFEVRLHPEWKRVGNFSPAEMSVWDAE